MIKTKNFVCIMIAALVMGGAFGASLKAADAAPHEVTIIIKNHKFEPAEVKAPAGKKLQLIVINQDNSVEEFESYSLKREKMVPANGTIKVSVGPLEPGVYDFFGEFHLETAKGVLKVE